MDKNLKEYFEEKNIDFTCNEVLENWIIDKAKKADQLKLITHNGKYTHTGVKKNVGYLVREIPRADDGYLRTGNCEFIQRGNLNQMDCFGNAAALPVYGFISLILEDGRSVIDHVEEQSTYLKDSLGLEDSLYQAVCEEFLKIFPEEKEVHTSKLVKQVYFPIKDDSYHLLSILTPSSIVSELKDRLDSMWRFSTERKEGKEARRKGVFHNGYADFYDITEVRYGGTKAQNVGILNSMHSGTSYLLPSLPPSIEERSVRLPRYDFFKNSLPRYYFEPLYHSLYKIFSTSYNSKILRDSRDALYDEILNRVVGFSWRIRGETSGWSDRVQYSHLPMHQKIWLDDAYKEERFQSNAWITPIVEEISRWMILYTPRGRNRKENPLGEDEYIHVRDLIEQVKEALL